MIEKQLPQLSFYKAPVPLLIGNNPLTKTFNDNMHEYSYLEYYKVIPESKEYYINEINDCPGGILFYNDVFENYALLYPRDNNDYKPSYKKFINETWKYMYFGLRVTANYLSNNHYKFTYYLNPFVNNESGTCEFINGRTTVPYRIYYDADASNFKYGFGNEVLTYDDYYFSYTNNDVTNGIGIFSDFNNVYSNNTLNCKTSTSFEDRLSIINSLALSGCTVGQEFHLNPDISLIENGTNNFSIDSLNKNLLFNNTAFEAGSNLSYDRIEFKYAPLIQDEQYTENNCYYYLRTNYLPDLDFEAGETNDNMLGVYEEVNKYKQLIVGSIVLGNNDDSFGNFIGVSTPKDVSLNKVQEELSNLALDTISDSILYTETPKSDSIDLYELYQSADDALIDSNDSLSNVEVLYGKTYNLDKPKYLKLLISNGLETPYKCNTLYILEDSPELFNNRRFWYCELPGTNTNWRFFSTSFYSPEYELDTLTFKYINLDDEDDIQGDVELRVKGLTRRNFLSEYGISNLVHPTYCNNLQFCKSSRWNIPNVYIGDWCSPAVEFE